MNTDQVQVSEDKSRIRSAVRRQLECGEMRRKWLVFRRSLIRSPRTTELLPISTTSQHLATKASQRKLRELRRASHDVMTSRSRKLSRRQKILVNNAVRRRARSSRIDMSMFPSPRFFLQHHPLSLNAGDNTMIHFASVASARSSRPAGQSPSSPCHASGPCANIDPDRETIRYDCAGVASILKH